MTQANTLAVRSVAFWSDRIADWALLRAVCRGEAPLLDEPQRLPPSLLLSAAERRRAPDSVQLALHVAHQAVQHAVHVAGIDAATLASVFASPHGDLGITHAMCEALARDPDSMSPTRFIHSVHNVVSGHWGIAQRCVRPSTSIAAGRCSFAVGLLEAATQAACNGAPVLLVAYQTQPVGATAQLTGTEGRIAVAAVLEPTAPSMTGSHVSSFIAKGESGTTNPTLRWHVANARPSEKRTAPPLPPALCDLERNHLADALVWLNALAHTDTRRRPPRSLRSLPPEGAVSGCGRPGANDRPVLALPLSAALDGGAWLHIEWEG
jgi:Beta-ketoacyl synthase, N-terminal domain